VTLAAKRIMMIVAVNLNAIAGENDNDKGVFMISRTKHVLEQDKIMY